MWREAASRAYADAEFDAGVDAAALTAAEKRLGRPLPSELTGLLQETDGIVGHHGVDVVWPLEQIVEQNLCFWSDDAFADLYMPFDALLFFGDNGGGDQFAFVRTPPRPDVFVWDHEDDSRSWAARNLLDYLTRSLGRGDDWYR
ncbi:SMI1/KNR4 family protein [Actinomadura sp. KC345]|uniref:SMI1/KNR4 family protein n=1 Tax=Actinomadura sp. KC345 TaxID=2530371 RepID=UPI001053337E|nr:SMI1/KNR4 family protein [Actinomadura sp. KC345]TDC40846.1 SMI1/KNR4 family protein [Actinomadura sp. KC345]